MHNKPNRQRVQQRRVEKKADVAMISEYARNEMKEGVKPKNDFQSELLSSIRNQQVTVAEAPAGSGKTFITMSEVSDWLKSGKIDRIIMSRASVGMGNTLGMLKGGMRDKFEPYLLAMVDVLTARYGAGFYETALNNKRIEFVPLEYVRGRSFENSVVIIDEFQLVKPDEAYTILTRLGEESKLICLGDRTQNDLHGQTGIEWMIDFSERHDLDEYVSIVQGTSDDIVRSGFCKAMVKAREKDINGE